MSEQTLLKSGRHVTDQQEQHVESAHVERAPMSPVPLPAALTVGRADDPAEAAADRMADSALARLRGERADAGDAPSAAPATVHRSPEPGPSLTGTIGAAGGRTDAATTSLIGASSGRPLPGAVRGRMESAFGRSFGQVRIHDGEEAAAASASLSARAFTHGSDVYFAKGQFQPDSAEGEHVLAHELAHVVQGGGTAHRFLDGIFGKKDPAKKLAEQKAAQEKKEQKEKEKKAKAEQAAKEKQEKAEAKQRARESKTNQKAEQKRLAGERKIGKAKRAEMQKGVVEDQQGDSVTSGKMNDLNERFANALAAEQRLFDTLVEAKGEEVARDMAYKATWLDTSDAELRAVRPPRETAAERLTRAVRSARTDSNVRNSVLKDTERGTMLSKGVELVYEMYVVEVDRLMGPPDNLSLVEAEQQATAAVWNIPVNAAAKKKRPEPGSALDEQAKKEARVRQRLNPDPAVNKPSTLEKASGITDDVEGYAGHGTKVTDLTSKILDKAGKAETDRLQEGLKEPDGSSGGIEEKIPVVGGLAKGINQAKYRVSKGEREDGPEKVLPKSVETKAAEGIGCSTNILMDLIGSVSGLMRFVTSVQSAHTDRTPSNIAKATKAAADALSTVAKTGKDAAELAKFIDPGVTSAVSSVIPGFNIFISVMSIISNAMTMTTQAIRVHETDNALFAARGKNVGTSSAPDVMVYPLLRVLQTYTKSLEQSVWATSVAIASLATSIATVASGGGYGIPAAVQAGVKVVDMLHGVGHFIADQVLVSITKKAQKDSLLSLEGAAENQLMKDPTMAVDGIILSAVKGDAAAEMFLANYRLDGKPIDRTVLDLLNADPANVGNEHVFGQIRSAVMAEMNEDEDPQYFYQKWLKKAGALFTSVKSNTYDKWKSTGEMAKDRNDMDGSAPDKGKRGAGWRMKMMFKGNKKFARSVKKTRVNKESVRPTPQVGPTVEDNSLMGYDSVGEFTKTVEVTCGMVHLAADATPQQQAVFASIVDTMPDDVLLRASEDPNNSDEWQQFFRDVLADRALVAAGA